MKDSGVLAQKFLGQLRSTDSREMFEQLATLVEFLENKNDPEPTEMYLVESIYHFFEKLKTLENNINSYVKESFGNFPGEQLTNLHSISESQGSSKIFDD